MKRPAYTHDMLRNRLLAAAGLSGSNPPKFDFAALVESEWSPLFEQLMRNRMLMGALRYGTLAHKRQCGHKWDLIGAIASKIALYQSTGNTEYLVDSANYCLLEFECGNHPNKHFKALDDHHDHCQVKH